MDLYQIRRGLGDPGPAKTLRTYAYNDQYASLITRTGFCIRNFSAWSSTPHFNFVRADGFFYVSAIEYQDLVSFKIPDTCKPIGYNCPSTRLNPPGDAGCLRTADNTWCAYHGWSGSAPNIIPTCYIYGNISTTNPAQPPVTVSPLPMHRMNSDAEDIFIFPVGSGTGNIVNVAIHAFAQGKVKTSIKVGAGTKTFSATTSEKFIFSWAVSTYATKPGGGAWSWDDLAAENIQAGIYLHGNEGINPGICRHFKLVVTSDDGSEVTLWPSGDVSATARVIAGNPLENSVWARAWAATGSTAYPCMEASTAAGSTIVDRYIASDLSEVPPRFSIIEGITVTSQYRASSAYAGSYARAFLEINGTKYYGTQRAINTTVATLHSYTDTWNENPATEAAWQYEDFVGIRFGLHYHAGGTATATALYLFDLWQDTEYQERAEIASLHSISATYDSHTQNSQNPIQPDELRFYLPPGAVLPERSEVVFYQRGIPRFQGLVWGSMEMPDGSTLVTAKAQQILLFYRIIPRYYHHPRLETFDSSFTIDELFSDAVPTHPSFAHMGLRQNYTTSEID
jgi:hypothetical protein